MFRRSPSIIFLFLFMSSVFLSFASYKHTNKSLGLCHMQLKSISFQQLLSTGYRYFILHQCRSSYCELPAIISALYSSSSVKACSKIVTIKGLLFLASICLSVQSRPFCGFVHLHINNFHFLFYIFVGSV